MIRFLEDSQAEPVEVGSASENRLRQASRKKRDMQADSNLIK